jgi:putative transposase
MARVSRKRSRTGIYHVMLRGVNRQTIFEDDEDRNIFITTLDSFRGDNGYKLYAYCLMSNHVHILIKELDDDISTAMKRICVSYVFWYNKKYERCGNLFQGRFRSETVETDSYFLTVLRYIHQNPIKANVVKSIEECAWTSYNDYISTDKSTMIDTGLGLGLFSFDYKRAIDLFIEFHNEKNDDKCLDFEDLVRLTDEEAREEIARLGIKNIAALQHRDKANRDSILRELKNIEGISIRQLARITGISKSVIDRADASQG